MNKVTITLNDKKKQIKFSESLATGSTYEVEVEGESKNGSLIVFGARGEVCAYAALSLGKGTLSTNTTEMSIYFRCAPIGCMRLLNAVLHWDGDGGENAGIGTVDIVSAGGSWSNSTTGAVALCKGDKGDTGHVGPMGPLTQIKDPDTDKWYNVYARRNSEGQMVLSVEQTNSDPKNGGAVALDSEVVKLAGAQTITGEKTFSSGMLSRVTRVIRKTDSNSYLEITGGTSYTDGAHLVLGGKDKPDIGGVSAGTFALKTPGGTYVFKGTPDGMLYWDGASVKGAGFAAAGMPNNIAEATMTLPESGEKIVFANGSTAAPYSGWIIFEKGTTAAQQHVTVRVISNSSTIAYARDVAVFNSQYVAVSVPIAKGQVATVTYTADGTTNLFRYIKAGAEF